MAATLHLLAGLPASGKTTVARRLERELPAVRFTLDEWVLRLYALPYDDPLYAERARACQDLIWEMARRVLERGVDVVLDWNQWSHSRRQDCRLRAEEAGVEVVLHVLPTPVERAVTNAAVRDDPWSHVLDEAGIRHLAGIFEPPSEAEGIRIVVETDGP